MKTILDAEVILGRSNVVRASDVLPFSEVCKKTELTLFGNSGYSHEQLASAADANNKGLANWFLVYHRGKSPQEILDERFELEFGFGEVDRNQKHHWFSHSNEGFWVDKKEESGYYLLNFIGEGNEFRETRFESLTFAQQEEKIKLLSTKMRAPLNIVMEAVFSIYDVHNILLLRNWNHLSSTRDYDGALIYAGSTGSKTGERMMNIFHFPKEQENDPRYYYGFGAVLMMKK